MSSHPMINRELAWIEFNARILNEATKDFVPLLERLKFLSIVSSNFDEFFMVRVAGLKNELSLGEEGNGDLPANSQRIQPTQRVLEAVAGRVRELVTLQYSCLTQEVLPGLAKAGLELLSPSSWSPGLKSYLEAYFVEQVFPLITPVRFDEDEELPTISNLQIHCAFELSDKEGKRHYALAQAPKNSKRFIFLPDEEDEQERKFRFALLEDLITSFASKLFPGFSVEGSLVFKVTRDADTGVDESRQEDFLSAMEEILAGRQNSTPVRLSYSGSSTQLATLLRKRLLLGETDCYRLDGPIDLAGFYELVSLELKGGAGKTSRLRDKPWKPIALPGAEGMSIWEEIETRDRLLFLPYESFDAIQRFLDEAADDPSVLAIKMTLYRTSGDSPVIKALIRAARNRKQVAVVVELKARFDEERNISWASTLEQAGAIVTYGVAKLKVHAKAALVLRRAKDGSIRRYLHLSTGNYNDKTARIYSDLSLFTANEELCSEASALFNMLTGYSTIQSLKHLAVGPFDLKGRILALIEREIQKSSPESQGLIEMKLNALADREVIQALYKASKAKVRVRLNVRGACTLLPGLPGVSDMIEVRSVVGRYLEHSRMLHFRNGGQDEVYLSSADCLPRNLERRVELMFPILDESLAKACREIFSIYFKDNEHSYRMRSDGSWEPVQAEEGEKNVYAQELLYKRIERLAEIAEAPPEQLVVRRRFKTG